VHLQLRKRVVAANGVYFSIEPHVNVEVAYIMSL